jgi:hypothetical protein
MKRQIVISIVTAAASILAAAMALAIASDHQLVTRPAPFDRSGKRTPVLVELFTSEGCSSCPPADQVLAQLQESQPVANAVVIPLSEHVDYWNYIGWADPFSSPAFSERQRAYARALRLEQVYTPQMVISGQAEFVGSDRSRALAAIRAAARAPQADVQAKPANAPDSPATLDVRVDNLPPVRQGDKAEVLLAITEDGLSSSVSRGENAGRRLAHTAVVRSMRALGEARAGHVFTASPRMSLERSWKSGSLSAVVFVQEQASGRVLGAVRVPLSGK